MTFYKILIINQLHSVSLAGTKQTLHLQIKKAEAMWQPKCLDGFRLPKA